MEKAIHPQASPKGATAVVPKKPAHPAAPAPAGKGAGALQAHAEPLAEQWAAQVAAASKEQPAAAPGKKPVQTAAQRVPVASEPLGQQWAEAMGVHEAVHSNKRVRQGLVAMPKGMSSVKRDGKTVLGNGIADGATAAAASGHTSFHARAAAAVLEAYLGKHGGTESDALVWICVGAALVLGAVVLLVASEIFVVSLVRSDSALEAAKAKGSETPPGAMGGARDFSGVADAATSPSVVGSPAYLAYRPYVTMVSMIGLFAGLVCLLSPVCEVLDIIGLPSGSCFLNVVFVALVVTFAGTAFLMGCCWCA